MEPVHVHVTEGKATAFATKIWITRSGKALAANNDSEIPKHILKRLIKVIEGNSDYIVDKWQDHFGEVKYYC